MSLWGRCLALLTRSIIVFANVCQKNVAMRVRQRCEKTTACGVVYACRDVRDYASTRLFVNLSTLYTSACKLLNISVLKRVDKPALCVHYCLHAARCPHHDCCMHCLHHVGCQVLLSVCADAFNGCATRDARHRGSVFLVGVTGFSLPLCRLHAMPLQ